jgi:hypothetical protein
VKETEGAASPAIKNNILTVEQVTAWRKQLFDGSSLLLPVQRLNDWPLNHYLWAAVFQAQYLFDSPESTKENWHTRAWDFGRFAKSHPALFNLDTDHALHMVKRTIGGKFWKEYFDMDLADAEMAFDHVWTTCRTVPGYDPLVIAVLRAKQTLKMDDGGQPAGYTTFLDVARSLKHQQGDTPFMLPCHKLAPELECTPITISRYRQRAIREGYLKVVKDHKYRSSGKGEATEFMFIGDICSADDYIEI